MVVDIVLLDKLIERSERRIQNAISREDWNDVQHYQGQLMAFVELKGML